MAEREGRTQFTFYESFFKSVARIRKAEDRAAAYDTICAYALYGQEPDLDALPDAAAVVFELARPNLDASRRKAKNGKLGGVAKQTEAKPKQVKDKEQEKDKDKDKEQMLLSPKPPSLDRRRYGEYKNVLLTDGDMEKLKAEFQDWEARIERLSSYIAQSGKSYKNHLATIRNWARKDREQEREDSGKGRGDRSARVAGAVGTWL